MCGSPKQLLIIRGSVSKEELDFTWDSILEQISEVVETERTKSIFNCWKKINENEKRIMFLESALEFLKPYYDPVLNKRVPNWDKDIAEKIAELGYDYIQYNEDLEKYSKQITIVENELKTLIVITNHYYNEYALLCPKDDVPIRTSEMEYEKELVILSKFQNGRIEKEKITCFEFFAIKNTYLDEVNRQKRKR